MEIDGKQVPFTTVQPILDLMNIRKPGIVIPLEPLLSILKQYDVQGNFKKIRKKFHNLHESKFGNSFSEVTDLEITGQPFTVTLLQFPNRGIWYWITGRQDVRLNGTNMHFIDPQEIWVSEFGFESWATASREEREQSYDEDDRSICGGHVIRPTF